MDAAVNVYEACFAAFDLDRCQYVLDHPHEEEAYLFLSPLNAGTVVPNLLHCVRSQRGSINLRDTRVISLLKKLMAYSIEIFHSSLDNQARVTACRAIISLLSIKSSSAFGLNNSNIIHFLLATLVKFISSQLQLQSKDMLLSNRKTKGSSNRAQLNLSDDKASRSSKRVATNNSHSSSHPKVVVDKGEADSDSDSEDVGGTLDCDEPMPMCSEGVPTAVVERLRCDLLRALVDDLSSHSELLSSPTDDHDLNLSAELLLHMLFLCSMGREYAASRDLCAEMFVGFAVARTATLSSSYRALLSILVMSPRGSSLPDVFKTRKSCHAIAMSALLRLISTSCVGDTATRLTLTLPVESLLVDIEDSSTVHEDAEPVIPSTDDCSTPISSYPHMCLVGVLQRITLACPDKVPVRQLLSACITDLLSCMQKVIEDCDRGGEDDEKQQKQKQSADNMRRCVSHYLTFLSRLTKSSKTSHRAFSVDIAGLIITAHWIWQQLSVQQIDSVEEAPASILLEAVLGRCGDSVPAVRVRAVSVLIDLLSHVSTNASSPAMEATVHATLFSSGPSLGCTKHSSLLDVLRDRASDEKIQVSSKAMQALSFVLSMPWTSGLTTGGAVTDAHHLSITDEDLQLFASKCADSSITVRRQAVSSLTELLLARPSDALIQDMWLQSILPMAYDPESTIVSKAAELMHRVLFNGLSQWFHTKKEQLDDVSLVWRLISKLAAMGLLKLFKAAVGAMLKHGYLSVTASRSSNQSSSVLEVMSIIKSACCFELDASYSMDQSTTHREGHSFTSMRGYCDADEVVRSAWVLMEALVSLEHVSVAGDKQQQQRFGDVLRSTGSADFVVKCFRDKHGRAGGDGMDDDDSGGGASLSLHCDDDDVRMFRVLQTLSHNLEASDVAYMRAQCLRCLEGLQFDCHVAGSAVSLLLQLSKVSSSSSSISINQMGTSASSNHPSALRDIVQSWAEQLVGSATVALRCFVFRDISASLTATRGVSAALISCLHRYLSSSIDGEDMEMEEAAIVPSIQAALFIIGEVAMLGFSMEEDQTKGSLGGDHFKLAVSDEVVNFVKILMGNLLPVIKNDAAISTDDYGDELKPIIARQCAQKLRACAFVTMGKLCMRDKSLARSQVNVFLREIAQTSGGERGSGSSSSSHLVNLSYLCGDSSMVRDGSMVAREDRHSSVVRSNALLVLGDMCVRYTNLVDRHVDTMSMCLQDSDSMVRKNALIILTQLLLQDFLKWKGFLLYRFLLLCIDADFEIAQFARNLLQKTLNAKFPQLLTNHFSEAVVILNGCIHHQIYHSVVRTNLNVVNGIDCQSSIDPKQSDDGNQGCFSIRLSSTQRFEIYSFMAESLDDESRIQVSAKLVQDVLSHAVDHPSMLKMDSHPSMLKMGSDSKTKRSGSGLNPSEAAIDDVFQLLKSPFLKICQKRSGAAIDDDAQGSDDLLDEGAGSTSQGTVKATFAQAKSKVLKKLSSKHLITHILPVVMSLKHVLEASNSPLQGPLMEYLVYLMKQQRPEVDEALQFDPTLRAEIEYDLKQYEKNKRDSSSRLSPRLSMAADGASVSSGPLPMLSSDRLPTDTIVKPVLRRSLGGSEGRGRTPSEALKSPGLHLGSDLIYSVMKTDRSSKGGAAGVNDDEDDLHRLTFSTSISDPTDLELAHRRDSSLGGLDAFYPNGGMKISPIKQQQKQSRRRSWSVVVNSLLPTGVEGPTEAPASSQPQRVTPAKKLRVRKSKSHQALAFSKTSAGIIGVPVLDTDDVATEKLDTRGSCNSSSNSDGENIVPSMNRLNITTSTGCASFLGMIVAAAQPPLQPSVRPIKRSSDSSSRTRPGVCDSLLTLSK